MLKGPQHWVILKQLQCSVCGLLCYPLRRNDLRTGRLYSCSAHCWNQEKLCSLCACYKGVSTSAKILRLSRYCIAFPFAFTVHILLNLFWNERKLILKGFMRLYCLWLVSLPFPHGTFLSALKISRDGNWQFTPLMLPLYLKCFPHYQLCFFPVSNNGEE